MLLRTVLKSYYVFNTFRKESNGTELVEYFGVLENLTSVTAAELLLCNYLRPNSTKTNRATQFLNCGSSEIFLFIMAQLYYQTIKILGRAARNLNMISTKLDTSGCMIIPLFLFFKPT